MGTALKLSDNYYWDSTGIIVKSNGGVAKLLSNALHEMQVGSGSISLAANGQAAITAITFPKAFSAIPVVIVSNATNSTDLGFAGVNIAVCHSPAPSKTGFTAAALSDKLTTTAKTVNFNWVAIVPKKAWTAKGDGGTFGGDTIQYERDKTKKGNGVGTASYANAASGTSLTTWDTSTSDDPVEWSIQSVAHNKAPLINSYYRIVTGTSSAISCAAGATATTTITIPNTSDTGWMGAYKNGFTPLCCINGAIDKTWHDVKVSAYASDTARKFVIRVWNKSSAAKNVTVNWMTFGTVD